MQDTQLAQSAPKPSALAVMASRFSVDATKLLDTLKNTVFKGATNDELLALVVVSNEYGLNPLTKEIYAFPAKGGGIVPVVSIDGWLRMMNDHPQFDGIEFEFYEDAGKLISCTAIIYRKDRSHPISVTEYLSECKRTTDPWKMEHRMLRHKATIQGARVAFGFSGIADEDEAPNIPGLAGARDVTPKAESSPLFKNLAAPSPQTAVPPESVTGDVRSQVPQGTAESFPQVESAPAMLIDAEPVSLVEQVKAKLAASKLKWSDVLTKLQSSGIGGDDFTALELTDEDTLKSVIELWSGIEKSLSKGGK